MQKSSLGSGIGARIRRRLNELFVLGGSPHANRAGLSEAEEQAFALVALWMHEAGLEVEYDPVGNLFGRLRGSSQSLPEVWIGSHLDTVPAGGRFDGALGVVAAIELAKLARRGRPARTIVVAAFRNEEGWRFGRSCFGSRALCGQLEAGELDDIDADGVSVREALSLLGRPTPTLDGWLDAVPSVFVELHIEQGPVLADAGAAVGVVEAIVGIRELSITFTGTSGHAGTQPMGERADALVSAASFIINVKRVATRSRALATVGQISAWPGASNVIPSHVALSVDLRSAEPERLERLERSTATIARDAAAHNRCEATVVPKWRSDPIGMSSRINRRLRASARELGMTCPRLHSGAGHDAGVLARAGVETAIVFVRSLNRGASHTTDEETDTPAIDDAVALLAHALPYLAAEP